MTSARLIPTIFILSALLVPATASAAIRLGAANTTSLSSGLVGYWTMDGTDTVWSSATAGTVKDRSGNGNTVTLNNMTRVASTATGKIGQALQFNGSNQYALTSFNLSGATAFTISFWVNQAASGGSVFGGWVSGNTAYNGSLFIGRTNTTCCQFFVGSVTSGFDGVTFGKWQHVAVVFIGGTSVDTYVNGVRTLHYTTSIPASVGTYTGTQFGANVASSLYSAASLDDVRIYNRALSATEIVQLYKLGTANAAHSNTTSLSAGLIGYWTMDGADTVWSSAFAATTKDKSGMGNTGTLNSMGQATSTVIGKIGQAFKLNGVNQFITTNYVQTSVTQYTVAAWVKTSASVQQIIVNDRGNGSGMSLTFYLLSSGNIAFRVDSNSILIGPNSNSTYNDGKWHHFVGTFTSTSGQAVGCANFALYVDGQPVGATTCQTTGSATSPLTGNGGTYIGYSPVGGGWQTPVSGLLDEVRIYNRALSAQDVQQLYAQGAANVSHSNTTSLSSGLIGYWTFDGPDTVWSSAFAATTKDKSGNNNTGTLTNMGRATSTIIGKVGQGLKFDGVNYINLGSPASLAVAKVSICAWIYPTAFSGLRLIYGLSNLPKFYMAGASLQLYNSANPLLSGSPLTLNKWQHVCATNDNTNTNYYIDGTLRQTSSDTGVLSTSASQGKIGQDPQSSGQNFVGTIDDVRVYNRALSDVEVAQLYAMGR